MGNWNVKIARLKLIYSECQIFSISRLMCSMFEAVLYHNDRHFEFKFTVQVRTPDFYIRLPFTLEAK